jgi:hypothetical protein
VSGIPGLPYPHGFSLLGWQDLARQIDDIQGKIEGETGIKPLLVGMDKNKTASGLSFYLTKIIAESKERNERDVILNTTGGKHLFGGNSLMYRYWFPIEQQKEKNMILVSSKPEKLTNRNILSHFRKTGPAHKIDFEKNDRPVGRYYYCLAEGYEVLQGEER